MIRVFLADDHSIVREGLRKLIEQDGDMTVVGEAGVTWLAPLDEASRDALRDHLFSAGELLRLNQLAPDPTALAELDEHQPDLFGEIPA